MDVGKTLGASLREVGRGERDGSPTHIVRAGRLYPASPTDLWTAFTDKARVPLWFAKITGDFTQGGRFSIAGNAAGEIVTCDPPRRLALTWVFGGNTSWVSVSIEKSDDGAFLTLEHEQPADENSRAHWDQYGPAATGVGWEMAMLGLDMHVSGDGGSTIAAGEAWAVSAAGKAMLKEWARAWGKAHVQAGADPQIAMQSAERTAAFYTGTAQ